METRLTPILLAEDDPEDVYLISEALDENQITNPLFIVENGEELLDYLHHEGKYTDTKLFPRPGLILLDLNMPLLDGREALEVIYQDPDLRQIPVVVLTTSDAEEDVEVSYRFGAKGYVTKPVTFKGLLENLKTIGEYWLDVVKLPEGEENKEKQSS